LDETHLLLLLLLDGMLASTSNVLRLEAHDSATPLTAVINVVVEGGTEILAKSFEFSLVFFANGGDSTRSGGFLVDDLSEATLTLDDAIRDILLAAKSGQPEDELDRIDIVGDDDELGLLGFDQLHDVVDTMLDEIGLLGGIVVFASNLGFGLVLKTVGLLFLGLRLVTTHKTQKLGGLVLVDTVVELVQRRWDLETLEQDALLSLKADVTRPAHVTGKVTLRLDVAADGKILWLRSKQRVLDSLGLSLGAKGRLR